MRPVLNQTLPGTLRSGGRCVSRRGHHLIWLRQQKLKMGAGLGLSSRQLLVMELPPKEDLAGL